MWLGPFMDFPREYGLPNRVGLIHNKQEFFDKINLYNTKSTFFTSLYSFAEVNQSGTRGIYSSAKINKIYFDSDKPSLEPLQRLHTYCQQKDLYHCFFFSGGGTHFYIGASGEVQNKKGSVANSQIRISEECNLKIGIDDNSDIDGHIIGNIAQMVRVPNTFNLKRKLYCIPLKAEDLTSLDHIKELAKAPRPGIPIYGHKYLDLVPYDSEPPTKNYDDLIQLPEYPINIEALKTENFPMCIKALLTDRFIKHRARYILILYLRELGVPLETTIIFLKDCLDRQTYVHCLKQEKQPYWLYNRRDLTFPSCETLRNWGFCKNEKCQGAQLY